jgi:hypothetical protein
MSEGGVFLSIDLSLTRSNNHHTYTCTCSCSCSCSCTCISASASASYIIPTSLSYSPSNDSQIISGQITNNLALLIIIAAANILRLRDIGIHWRSQSWLSTPTSSYSCFRWLPPPLYSLQTTRYQFRQVNCNLLIPRQVE